MKIKEEKHIFLIEFVKSASNLRACFVQPLYREQEMKKREKANFRIVNQLVPGTKVRAIYADEENDPSWYDAVINSVEVRETPLG